MPNIKYTKKHLRFLNRHYYRTGIHRSKIVERALNLYIRLMADKIEEELANGESAE